MRENGVHLQPEFELATSDMLIRFAMRGFGIAGVAEDFALEAMEKGEIFRLHFDREIPKRHFCIVTDEKVPMTAAARTFLFNMFEKLLSLGLLFVIQQQHWTPRAARIHVPAPALVERKIHQASLNDTPHPVLRMP